ncbi:MAG: methyltransferase domain-containing protein [Myxococcales bacterium]|nr:methyltransferase domain-containing protein [Myxococcales bacterium]
MSASATAFVGSIPELYDRHLGPVLFEPYARELARRLPPGPLRILEIAAGTGRLTRQLLAALPATGAVIATDLNPPMLVEAAQRITDARVTWRQADAQALPLAAGEVDVVACQFGLMFVPDKAQAVREMRRVLRPGGRALISTWDALGRNVASRILHALAVALAPDDPPAFMLTPFSMFDPAALHALFGAAGFAEVRVETVEVIGESPSAADFAIGLVRGNPLWLQLVERGVDAPAFERQVTAALVAEFGDCPCRHPLSAHVVTAIA